MALARRILESRLTQAGGSETLHSSSPLRRDPSIFREVSLLSWLLSQSLNFFRFSISSYENGLVLNHLQVGTFPSRHGTNWVGIYDSWLLCYHARLRFLRLLGMTDGYITQMDRTPIGDRTSWACYFPPHSETFYLLRVRSILPLTRTLVLALLTDTWAWLCFRNL